ncbi:MAG: hypothetical protein QOD02_4000 [Mycobacterium sp.]|nr:hypothetical protein [Mycobacterium sp.]
MSRMGLRALAPLRVRQASYQEEARNHGTQADRLRSTGALAWLSARRITDGGAGVTQRTRRFGAIRTALGQAQEAVRSGLRTFGRVGTASQLMSRN